MENDLNLDRLSQDLLDKLKHIKLLALDVDGILSDGTLFFSADGDEVKGFSILDGLGIKLLQDNGVTVAIITGRTSPLTARRAANLGIKHIAQGREDKKTALLELCGELKLEPADCAYMGDDLPDLSAIRHCAVGFTVPNAHWFVRQHADHCTQSKGGKGAVREVCDIILHAKGRLESTLEAYL
ncbi:HAD family hydrolase [Hahella sp. CCB-MM4]|uniref:KdsC family phosphatase n=1 Tax=Hahella sp. (strain CCB-MM4) TaxID=1926491 RepID=UPI000B9B047B|nr:HAD hydrolase family protein [Hahella sp. CCB-MM4]OZG70539.1 HAD family hydrolase [Hahella sp. CCB-MM4]